MTNDLDMRLEAALGGEAVRSLGRRRLLAKAGAGTSGMPGRDLVADRVLGALLGAAAGSALGEVARRERRRRGLNGFLPVPVLRQLALPGRPGHRPLPIEQLLQSADAGLGHGWAAAPALSDSLVAGAAELRRPGQALARTVMRRRQGLPWYEAGVASFGNGAVSRAAAVGLVNAAAPEFVPTLSGIDAAVTHAHPRAVAASSVAASAIAQLLARIDDELPTDWLAALASTVDEAEVRMALQRAASLAGVPADRALPAIGLGPLAASTVAVALWCVTASPGDPATAIALAASAPGDAETVATLTGALAGAAWGAARLPSHWTSSIDRGGELQNLAGRITDLVGGTPATPPSTGADAWFLLDRSGSMGSIATDVVGGFNQFLAEQRAEAPGLRMTLVQFDSQAPHDVLIDRVDVMAVRDLDERHYRPRGATPLYDALALLLDRAERANGAPTDQLVVVFTDGLENASHRTTRDEVFSRISRLKEAGWTFVFLGANQDSYAAGGDLGVAAGSVSNYVADRLGVDAAFRGIGRGTREWRRKSTAQRWHDRDEFWGDIKEAEEL